MINAPAIPVKACWNQIGIWGARDCVELDRHVHCRNCPVYSSAAVRLLDAKLPADYFEKSTQHFAQPKIDTARRTESVVIFRIYSEWLALPSRVFVEVSERRAIHSLPHRRNGTVLGVVNIRGELLVCVSLASALGVEQIAAPIETASHLVHERLLVVSDGKHRLVFPVQEIHGIQRFSPADFAEVPATVAKATATFAKNVLAWERRTVGFLDTTLLFHALGRSLA